MKKISIILFLVVITNLLPSETKDKSDEYKIDATVQFYAHPFIPDSTKVTIEFPFGRISDNSFLKRVETKLWYYSSTPYFSPIPFFETGVLMNIELAQGEIVDWYVGLGSAFSLTEDIISIPAIVSTGLDFFINPKYQVNFDMLNQVYREGIYSEAQVLFVGRPFDFGLTFKVGGIIATGIEWVGDELSGSDFALSYGITAAIGYQF